jgi:hypothetical protein
MYARNPYLDALYAACSHAQHVTLDVPKIIEAGDRIAFSDFVVPSWRGPLFPDDDLWAEFIFWTSSINFAFTDVVSGIPYRLEYPQGSVQSGANAMFAAFARALARGVPALDAEFWRYITPELFEEFFRGDTPLPMQKVRRQFLAQNAFTLIEQYGGKAENILQESNFNCFMRKNIQGLVDRLASEFAFRDGVHYFTATCPSGIYLTFNKRAQLFAMLYQGRAQSDGSHLPQIAGYEYLTIPADYRVPQALEYLGLICYDAQLKKRIMRGELIDAGSLSEIEIRMQTVIAAEELKTEINALRLGAGKEEITMLELDSYLWGLGRQLGKRGEKHHLTPTTAY